MLLWYVPSELKAGAFDVFEPLGNSLNLAGKGTFEAKEKRLTLKGKLADAKGAGPDIEMIWQVGSNGWVTNGEGTTTDSGGSIHFSLTGR
jgi:hypothetical protein